MGVGVGAGRGTDPAKVRRSATHVDLCTFALAIFSMHTRVSPRSHFPPHGVVFTLHSTSDTGRVTRAAQCEFVVTDQSPLFVVEKSLLVHNNVS